MTIAAVVFDFFGTLTVAATAAERYDGHRPVATALDVPVEAYARVLAESWPLRARGKLGSLSDTLLWVARECGVEPAAAQLRSACVAREAEQLRHIRLRDTAMPTLRALDELGLAVGLVSDCTHEVPAAWHELELAPVVDEPVFSVELGFEKPAPEIYVAACSRLGVAPEDCLYVGDGDSHELPGAEAVGMRAIRLLAPDHGAAHVIDPVEWAGATVSELGGVLDLVKAEL